MSGLESEMSQESCPKCGERQVAVYWSLDTGDNVMWKCQSCGTQGAFNRDKIMVVQ